MGMTLSYYHLRFDFSVCKTACVVLAGQLAQWWLSSEAASFQVCIYRPFMSPPPSQFTGSFLPAIEAASDPLSWLWISQHSLCQQQTKQENEDSRVFFLNQVSRVWKYFMDQRIWF